MLYHTRWMELEFPRLSTHARWIWLGTLALVCFRFAHIHLLWADEDYHLAAAIQILHGKTPYRDFWYDKPPLAAAYYLLIGGYSGWPLRILDAAYVALACWLVSRLARVWWTEAEGWTAAFLLAFFTTFYLPSAVVPFAADGLMLAPHLAALYCARRKLPVWAGIWTAVAFLVNPKALFVLGVCALWLPGDWPLLLAGFAAPTICAALAAVASGAWHGYLEQVWRWGLIYTAQSPLSHPVINGIGRSLNWLGFHAALAVGACFAWPRLSRSDRYQFLVWLTLSFAAVCLGFRFVPRYFLQVLPVLVVLAARGFVILWRERRQVALSAAAALLLIPLVRFGPRYVSLTWDNLRQRTPQWADAGMDLDSRNAAHRLCRMIGRGDTLFVWGYRPDLYVYTRLASPGLFWDSQPLTGVPADRHLSATQEIDSVGAAANRAELVRSHPTWIVDGLGLLNPKLAPTVYPEVQRWLDDYRLVGRSKLSLIYRRK